ncbi:hypothetical protein AC578_1273 [Pseudocercospora eumusae]|uniref:Uncharacterized protein n=1 Tax=Pseudocercospora eumusae TaxID=321146 RepID=A0A139HUV8_9PEZI|nr:hypothetical protein AC578_1273 [Pseudocercospora eumusae]
MRFLSHSLQNKTVLTTIFRRLYLFSSPLCALPRSRSESDWDIAIDRYTSAIRGSSSSTIRKTNETLRTSPIRTAAKSELTDIEMDAEKQTKRKIHTDLATIMRLEPLRDEVMYWLTPLDALNLRLTRKDMIPPEDMGKYTSIFKYVIPNRRWLMNKMEDGYNFTIVSGSLNELMHRNAGSVSLAKKVWNSFRYVYANRIACVILIVTRGERFIPCTKEFVDKRLFASTIEDEKMIRDETSDIDEPPTRTLSKFMNGLRIEIMCPLVSSTTDLTLHLSPYTYLEAFAITYGDTDKCEALYAHMSRDACRIVGLIANTWAENLTFEKWSKTLFSIRTSVDRGVAGCSMLLHIGKPDHMYRK